MTIGSRSRSQDIASHEHEDTTPVRIIWNVKTTPTVAFNKSRVEQYREKWNGDFFLVIAGDELIAGDYHCIPYKAVLHMLDEAYLVHDAKNVRHAKFSCRSWKSSTKRSAASMSLRADL